jgi:IS30 family transposase
MGRSAVIIGAQREELWRRYKAGETILGIGRALGRRQGSIHRVLQATGGIVPARRSRSSRVLSFSGREEISRGVASGCTFHAIAKTLNRAVSTVSQEVARHGGRWRYRAAQAVRSAWESARRPKLCLLAKNRQLQRIVAVKLKQDWSPQQVAGWLRDQYPDKPEL